MAGAKADAHPFVVLHEGLGSVAMWKDFPAELARVTGRNVFVYSRQGYGKSEPLRGKRTVRYMHDEALSVLPQLLDQHGIESPVLLGHSDGASIALIHAGNRARAVSGVVALAPHVFVEDIAVENIAVARTAYLTTSMRERLAQYHDDVDAAFWGWNDIWLSPAFRSWNIENVLPSIGCPVLAIQGVDDEYGTMEQLDRIERGAPHVTRVELQSCRHSPHRDQPAAVLSAIQRWLVSHILSSQSGPE